MSKMGIHALVKTILYISNDNLILKICSSFQKSSYLNGKAERNKLKQPVNM